VHLAMFRSGRSTPLSVHRHSSAIVQDIYALQTTVNVLRSPR